MEMFDSTDTWVCDECGKTVVCGEESYVEVGQPYCADCDKLMTFVKKG